MLKDEKIVPPASVIILPGPEQEQSEFQVQSLPGAINVELPESIKNYLQIRSQKPGYQLSVLGVLFFITPFIILSSSDIYLLEDFFNLASICCVLFFISIFLILTNSSQHNNWKEEIKKARKQIKQTEQIPYPPEKQWPLVAGTLFTLGGLIWIGANLLIFIIGSILGPTCFLYYFYITHQQNTIYDARIEDRINNLNQLKYGLEEE